MSEPETSAVLLAYAHSLDRAGYHGGYGWGFYPHGEVDGEGAAIRLFAVGDADQSIYAFAGANPELLESLTRRADVRTIRLRFNYRSRGKIIRASLGAPGEERDYRGVDGASEGDLSSWHVP